VGNGNEGPIGHSLAPSLECAQVRRPVCLWNAGLEGVQPDVGRSQDSQGRAAMPECDLWLTIGVDEFLHATPAISESRSALTWKMQTIGLLLRRP